VAEPFKLLINAALVQRAAARLALAWPEFDAARFAAQASAGLDALELKARALHVCAALEATLPADFEPAAALLERAMAEPEPLQGWILWPVGEFVARRGQGQPERALQVLHRLTQLFTAEFALRPFIVQHPALVFATLEQWTRDPSDQVRRLVSEGSRPRLPWGLQLKALIADPAPTLPLLRALQDDASETVRRSVANHLNDIAKDHPAVVADWLETHLPAASPQRRALLRHASRTLVKRGDPRVLAAWGLGQAFAGQVSLTLRPKRLVVGDSLDLQVTLSSRSRQPQKLALDYAVHHVKADGRRTPKVFKGWLLELGAGERRELSKRHSMRAVTTRRYHPGGHRVELLANGRVVAAAEFDLRVPA